jgi:hypothetical protein
VWGDSEDEWGTPPSVRCSIIRHRWSLARTTASVIKPLSAPCGASSATLSSGSRFMSGSSDMTSEAALWTASECTRGSRGAAACMHTDTDVCCRVAAGRPACDPRSSYYARSSYSCTDYGLILTHACGGSARAYDRTARTVRTKKCTRHARGEMGGQLGQQARKVRDVVFWPSLRPVLVSRSHQVCDSGWACCGQPVAKVRLPLLTFRPLRVKMLY